MAAVAMRAAFVRLGFTNAAANDIAADQGIDSVDELSLLTDSEIEALCKVVRRPGGTIANPQAGVAGQPPTVPNPGKTVSLRAENNMKLAAYWLRFRANTSRTTTAAEITLPAVRSIRSLREWEEAHEPQDAPEGIIQSKDWHKTLEAIQEYLRTCLGVTKIPLAYVVRPDEAITPDPAPAEDNRGWPSMQDELINRAPIMAADGTPVGAFLTDRATVWNKISALTRDKPCWTYVKVAQRTRDGRMAFLSLRDHYLGANMVGLLASSAETKLQNTKYSGEKRRWNFERYASLHVEQHGILEGLASRTPPAHPGIDERSKVRYLVGGIQTKELETCTTQILSSQTLLNDFSACVNLYKDYLATRKTTSGGGGSDINISSVKAETRRKTPSEYKFHAKDIQDRYYKAKEYNTFSPGAKKRLFELRDGRDGTPAAKRAKTDKTMGELAATFATLATAVLEKDKEDTDKDKNVSFDEQQPGVQGNRNHSALTRQKK